MYKITRLAGILFVAVAVWAQSQVATVTSSTPFTLRGAGITPGQGVPMWPVLAGDNVAAGNAITIVTFPDGSVITLAPGSEGKFDLMNGEPSFQLVSGTAHYSLKTKKAVVVIVGGQPVVLANVSGTVTMSGTQAAAVGFWTGGHIAAVAIGAGAAAAGVGAGVAAADSGGAAVSPSK